MTDMSTAFDAVQEWASSDLIPKTPPSAEYQNIGRCVELIKKQEPKIYADFFTRIYKSVDRFSDWRWPLVVSIAKLLQLEREPTLLDTSEANRNNLAFITGWANCQLPMFFVEKALLDAVKQTNPPMEFFVQDFKMPYETMCFILPRGQLSHATQGECEFIGISRLKAGKRTIHSRMPSVQGEVEIDYKEDHFILHTAFRTTSNQLSSRLNMQHMTLLLDDPSRLRSESNTERASKEDFLFYAEMLRIGLNLILAMEVRPELLERERKLKQHKRDRNQYIWQPNVIGAKYRTIYKGGAEKGTHSSPRMHWRCGHFRRQGIGARSRDCVCGCAPAMHSRVPVEAYDPDLPLEFCMQPTCDCEAYRPKGYEQYKTVWIEPVLVKGIAEGGL